MAVKDAFSSIVRPDVGLKPRPDDAEKPLLLPFAEVPPVAVTDALSLIMR